MSANLILARLSGHDSRNPLAFDALVEASGLPADMLQALLDQMFHAIPAAVNRCEVTRYGKTQMLYWPTGVIQSFKGDPEGAMKFYGSWTIREKQKRKDEFKRGAKSIRAIPTAVITTRMADEAIQKLESFAMDEKSISRKMRELIARQGKATSSELNRINESVRNPAKYLSTYIDAGLITVTKNGNGGRSGNTFSIALGVAPEELLVERRPTGRPKGTSKQESGHDQSKTAKVQSETATCTNSQTANKEPIEPAPFDIPLLVATSPMTAIEEPTPEPAAKPVSSGIDVAAVELTTFCHCHNVFIDGTGQLVIQHPGRAHILFPLPDTIRIKKLLTAIDLESLSDAGRA